MHGRHRETLSDFQAAHVHHHKPSHGQAGITHKVGGCVGVCIGLRTAHTQRSTDAQDKGVKIDDAPVNVVHPLFQHSVVTIVCMRTV